ncbi:MAG: OadG family protein [bacterium]|nr:OadG family protein [bacterium]
MDIKDALTVTVLGISVVFIGLILTNLMIRSFSVVPRIARFFKKKEKEPGAETPVKTAEVSADMGDVEPEIIAVITAVLEVEFKKLSLLEGKFTFR